MSTRSPLKFDVGFATSEYTVELVPSHGSESEQKDDPLESKWTGHCMVTRVCGAAIQQATGAFLAACDGTREEDDGVRAQGECRKRVASESIKTDRRVVVTRCAWEQKQARDRVRTSDPSSCNRKLYH